MKRDRMPPELQRLLVPGGNYLKAQRIAEDEHGIPPSGEVWGCEVLHDPSCSMLANRGACDCEPELIYQQLDDNMRPTGRETRVLVRVWPAKETQ